MSSKKWLCLVCGYVHEGTEPPEECPVCGAGSDQFEQQVEEAPVKEAGSDQQKSSQDDYLSEWARPEDDFEKKYEQIQHLAKTGKSSVSAMRTQRTFPDWDSIVFKGTQLDRFPLNQDDPVVTRTMIGRPASSPLSIDLPVYVSHMSFGALSKEAKIALARGSRMVMTAIGSGEGGFLEEERQEAGAYIYELGTAAFSHKDEAIIRADAVEIKIGQAAKPGMGGHLPKEKVTKEIAAIRGIPAGEDCVSPARHDGVDSRDDLLQRIRYLRDLLKGKPVGVKIAAGHIEGDLEFVLQAGPDFITIDCRGGGTGAAPNYIKDNVCIPPIFAIHRARAYLDRMDSSVTLCVTGGFRDSADVAKAIAMGADAVALGTSSLIAIGCQQYRICHTGRCPVGITTQDPELRARLKINKSVERFVNFYSAIKSELINFARINGRNDIHDLDRSDILTISDEVAKYTDIEHV